MFIVPVHNLRIEGNPSELLIEDKILLRPSRLIKKWKYFGLPKTYKDFKNPELLIESPPLFDDNHYLLILQINKTSYSKEDYFKAWDEVNRFIYILASSDLARGNNYSRGYFGSLLSTLKLFDSVFETTPNNGAFFQALITPTDKFDIYLTGFSVREFHFFPHIFPLFNSKLNIDKNWEKDLKQAVLLAGKAVCAKEHWESFTWCFIAIERLLKLKSAGSFNDQVQLRIKALLGEYNHYNSSKWDKLIDELYKKRCHVVHSGEIEIVSLKDAIIAESLLKNILLILLKNTKIFKSKSDLIQFGEKFYARKVLNLKFKPKGDFKFSIPDVDKCAIRIIENRRWYDCV